MHEDQAFLQWTRTTVRYKVFLGWVLIALAVGSGAWVWTKVDQLDQWFQSASQRASAELKMTQTKTVLEAKLLKELDQDDGLMTGMARTIVLLAFALPLSHLVSMGILCLISTSKERRYLRIIDRLESSLQIRRS